MLMEVDEIGRKCSRLRRKREDLRRSLVGKFDNKRLLWKHRPSWNNTAKSWLKQSEKVGVRWLNLVEDGKIVTFFLIWRY
jgi:hypothetical protein